MELITEYRSLITVFERFISLSRLYVVAFCRMGLELRVRSKGLEPQ